MAGVETLDSNVDVYDIDVRGKQWHQTDYINNLEVLKSVAFKIFKLAHPDDQMDLSAFTCRIVSHQLKAAKLEKKLPPNITYPCKRLWKGNTVVLVNERAANQHFIENSSQKRCKV